MKKSADAFRSIGEVATLIGVAPHVLRYWETQFPLLKPMKRPDGRRYYRPDDVSLAAGIFDLLREEGLTIRGAKKLMSKDRGQSVRERGAAFLGAAQAAPADSAAEPASAIAQPEPFDTVASDDVPIAEDVLDWEGDEMSQTPRARQRKRRLPGDDGALPLFPELDRGKGDTQWLPRLILLSGQLRNLRAGDAAWKRSQTVGAQLSDAIQRLY